MPTHVLPTKERLNFNGLASPMDPNCAVDTFSVSLKSCELGSDSFSNLVVSHIPRTDNPVCVSDSITTAESDEQIDKFRHDDASEAIVPETVQSLNRKSTLKSKFKQKTENQKAASKTSRIADKRAALDLLFLNVARRRRSGLFKHGLSSSWGSLKHVTEVFEQSKDVNTIEHMEFLKARTAHRGGKRNKGRKNQISQTSKDDIPAITRCIRLKVKVGKKATPSCPLIMLPGTDTDLDNIGGVSTRSSKIGIDIGGKMGEKEVASSLRSDLNENLNKAAVTPEVLIVDGRLLDKYNLEKSCRKTAEGFHGLQSQDGVRVFEGTLEYRYIDTGTSPDSEVINLNPEAHSCGIMSEHLEDDLTSSKDADHGYLTSLSPSETSSENASSKDLLYQSCHSDGKGGLPGKETTSDCIFCDKYDQEILDSIRYNGVSVLTDSGAASVYGSSTDGCHIELLHSSLVAEVGGLAETSKLESDGEFELSHVVGLKSPESQFSEKVLDAASTAQKVLRSSKSKDKSKSKSKSKSEVSESVNHINSDCRQRGCEAKSSDGHEIKGNNVDEERCQETGIDEAGDVTYGYRSANGGSSNVNTLPINFGNQQALCRDAWVCCDDCEKWRRIPAVLANSFEDTNCKWFCKDNLDKTFADCSIPQEMSNAAINEELGISNEVDRPDICLNSNQILQKQPTVPVQAPWKLIKSNLFLHRNRKSQSNDEVMVCHCEPPLDGHKGCRDGCLNRMLNIECGKGTCPCGELCSNLQFQKRKYANLKCFRSGKKGFGLQAQEDIYKGQFLIEYVGEVLDMHAYEARQREYASKGHKHFYFMTLNSSEVIDACTKGNLGRFINHSCEPNCQTEKWMVNGEICIGFFALRDIKKGEEVTFDYNYVRVFGAALKKCVCGSSHCRGYIGGDPENTEVIVQDDSDDEYLEPVMLNEDATYKLDNLMPGTCFFNGTEILSPESLLNNNDDMGKCAAAVGHLDIATENKLPEPLFEEESDRCSSGTIDAQMEKTSANEAILYSSDALKLGPSSKLRVPVGSLHSVQPAANLSQSNHLEAIPLQTNEGNCKITFKNTTLCSGGEEDERLSFRNIERKEACSLSSTVSNLSPHTSKVKKCESIKDETARTKSRPRTKSSCPSSLVEGGKTENSVCLTKPQQIESNSLTVSCNPKKFSQSPLDGLFEVVQQILNELLDADGGISRRKDASRVYLKLLYQTVASGYSGNGEGIQSNRVLSMILDALLKTKSRTVLADILNKNGLQMLHNVMKRYRKEFIKIPILRKLLKVLEYLAVREILTLENINQGPSRSGVVSFKDSILELCEHDDKQVHRIARSFRDRWIQRRRQNFIERDVDRKNHQRGSNFIRSSASRNSSSDRDWRPMEEKDSCAKQSPITNAPLLDCGVTEISSASCTNGCVPSGTLTRKRKSRWEQPADITSSNKESKRNTDEDTLPGFSSSRKANFVQSNVSKNFTDVAMGQPQERFISRMTISYGVPLSFLQKPETPQAVAAEIRDVAPSMPFQPFPPLPSYPRDRSGSQEQGLHETVVNHWGRNQNTPTTSGASPQGIAIPFQNNQPSFQGGGGMKYFRQQKWNNPRNGPPWNSRNNWRGGFKRS